jgi:hypothetical protein
MLDSGLFIDQVGMINQWQTDMRQFYLGDLTTEERRKKASLALCYLLFRIIRPLLVTNKANPSLLAQIYPFEKKCRQILEITCPDENLRQKLMTSYPLLAKKRVTQKERIEKVTLTYSDLEEQLNQMETANLQSLREVFEHLQNQLLDLNGQQTNASETVKKQIQALIARMAKMSADLGTQAEASAVTGSALLAYKSDLLRNVRDMRSIVKGVSE